MAAAATISVDEFQALERKVLQTVELIKRERETRTTAEAACAAAESERDVARAETAAAQTEVAELRERLAAAGDTQSEVESLQREREAVRERVEKMLATLDELL